VSRSVSPRKTLAVALVATCLGGCSRSERGRAREQSGAREATEPTTGEARAARTGDALEGRRGEAAASTVRPPVDASPKRNAETFYDEALDVTWLVDANLAATERFGLENAEIGASGSMTYRAAERWVKRMNERRYLGRDDWTLPATPDEDDTCERRHAHTFGFGCRRGALSGLNTRALAWPATAVPLPPGPVGPFRNLQPYLYWSGSRNTHHTDHENGYTTFSFDNGFQGANVDANRIYALPMAEGDVAKAPGLDEAGRRRLSSATVYDAAAGLAGLADGNLAATETFGVAGIAPTGAMSHSTAEPWVQAMNQAEGGKGYLSVRSWTLPPTPRTDPACSLSNYGFDCRASALAKLYYGLLGRRSGEPMQLAPSQPFLAFRNLRPYLYWSCQASKEDRRRCGSEPPRERYHWSFSFGNGFTGTTITANRLYVMVYHPGRSTPH
jgi:hypothetical protein